MTQNCETTRYGTLQLIDGRQVLRFERRLAHPVKKVWRAITEPGQLRHWFPADMVVRTAFEAGGELEFVFREGEWETLGGRILELDPPRVFAYTWDAEVLRFELRPDGRHTVLTFTCSFDDRVRAAGDAAGWQGCLEALERVVLDGAPADHVQPRWAEWQDAYVERFGLAEGTTERTGDGWMVRFERLLMAPPATVWAFLTEAGDHASNGADTAETDGTAGATPGTTIPSMGDPPPLRFTNGYVPAGALTTIDPPACLEYEWRAEDRATGRVRWELSVVPGGARVVLTQTLPHGLDQARLTALAAWHTHLDLLTRHLRGEMHCWPEGRTEELRERYARGMAGSTA